MIAASAEALGQYVGNAQPIPGKAITVRRRKLRSIIVYICVDPFGNFGNDTYLTSRSTVGGSGGYMNAALQPALSR